MFTSFTKVSVWQADNVIQTQIPSRNLNITILAYIFSIILKIYVTGTLEISSLFNSAFYLLILDHDNYTFIFTAFDKERLFRFRTDKERMIIFQPTSQSLFRRPQPSK